ncbi:MAG TPA: outer membrane beta-barrel protein [Chthoniobacterales bacterium]|nr:outer membrane beta-barrel protein [Chthoniobacterales bacterium]
MPRLKSKPGLFFASALWFVLSQFPAKAQEAVSTTSSSSSSESTATSSTSAPASIGPTTDLSTSATGAPSAAVTGSATNTPTLERNPSGTGVFAPTPLKLYATLSGGYDDNVNTSSNKQSSAFTGGNLILDYTFGDPRLQLTLNAGAGGTYYFSHLSNQDYDIDLKGALGITFKASPRLTLGGTVLLDYLTEPSFQYVGGINTRSGNYLYSADKAFLQYQWSHRFATKTSYTFEAYNYDNASVGTFSNRVSNTFGTEFRLQMVPTTNLIAEYRYGIVSYENSFLNSTAQYALGGIDHTFNPRLVASFRGGAEFRSYDNDGDRTGPYFEGNVTYALGRRTSLNWLSRYGIEEPDVPGSQSRTTFRTGVQTQFSMTSRTSANVELYYVHDDYHPLTTGPFTISGFSEDTFDAGFTLRYGITGLFGVQAGYHYTNVGSDASGREYSRNRLSAGVNLTF